MELTQSFNQKKIQENIKLKDIASLWDNFEKLKKQNWTFTLIGTDNLDVETMARGFSIDEHLEFKQDDAGTNAMFECERRSRERYYDCIEQEERILTGFFFKKD